MVSIGRWMVGVACAVALCHGAIVTDVRMKLSAGDLLSAESLVEVFHKTSGQTAEYAAALGWLARGAWQLNNREAATRHLAALKPLLEELSKTKKIHDDAFLLSATGTAIEVEGQLMSRHRGKAIAFFQSQLDRYRGTTLAYRIQKNINLLSMEGKPAPDLDARYRGKPVLLFLWAHWCGDCKAQAPVVAAIHKKYAARGLQVEAPTRRYGQVPSVKNPTAEQEDKHIESIWKDIYSGLDPAAHPIGDPAMLRYGVSSTPTFVLIDKKGIVRLYCPYRMTERELSLHIEPLLR